MRVQEAIQVVTEARKQAASRVALYPYNSYMNSSYLNQLLSAEHSDLESFVANKRILDIGCGDGDMAFICEMIGAKQVAALDWADTNFNFMQGVRTLREQLHSKVHIFSGNLEDMDLSFLGIWDAILFLGTLYHLPNPIRVLRKLSVVAPQIFASTRIFDVLPDNKNKFSDHRLGYLLNPAEANNDNTNWWILTEAGVKTMFERSGWRVLNSHRIDQLVGKAEPAAADKDGRLFLRARSVYL